MVNVFRSKPHAQGDEEAKKPGFFARMLRDGMESYRERKLERELAEVGKLTERIMQSIPSPTYLRDIYVDFERFVAYVERRGDCEERIAAYEMSKQQREDSLAAHRLDSLVEELRKLGAKSEFPEVRDAVAKRFMACPNSNLSPGENNVRLYLYNPEHAEDIYAGSDGKLLEFGMKEAARLREWGVAAALALRGSGHPGMEERMLREELKSATIADYLEAEGIISMYSPFKESEDHTNDPYYEQQKAIAFSRIDHDAYVRAYVNAAKKENPYVVRLLDAQMHKIRVLERYGPEEFRKPA